MATFARAGEQAVLLGPRSPLIFAVMSLARGTGVHSPTQFSVCCPYIFTLDKDEIISKILGGWPAPLEQAIVPVIAAIEDAQRSSMCVLTPSLSSVGTFGRFLSCVCFFFIVIFSQARKQTVLVA